MEFGSLLQKLAIIKFKTILFIFDLMAKSRNSLLIDIVSKYEKFHFSELSYNRFTHNSLINGLSKFESKKQLIFDVVGYSEEGREIKSITFGKGKAKVLLWSQMHGNESTATRAILDLLNFLTASDEFNSLREKISQELTLQFIPMLNPDGAEHFQRRTSSEIDMNRDADALQSPEGKILDKVVSTFKPAYAFNLHDQRRFYNVKDIDVPSSMSFLAPAYNKKREVNKSREKAMQIIAGINDLLQQFIPSGIGLYDDTYNYRSFGDYIQAKGVSTILVEAGWLANDMEKEEVRKLNFSALLRAFEMTAYNKLNRYSISDYFKIPPIDVKLFDVLIKDVNLGNGSKSKADIGINRTEHSLEYPNYYSESNIDDIGDLKTFYGFEAIDGKGLTVVSGKSVHLAMRENMSLITVKRLLNKGVLFMITEDIPFENHVPFPINIVHPRKLNSICKLVFEGHANFLLVDKNQSIKYIILNGFVIKPGKINTSINGLVLF
jgi:zinc carboxypeptidase